MDDDTNVVGAALPQEQVDYVPMLEGMGEDKVVAIHNPLGQDFRVQYARSRVAPIAKTAEQHRIEERLGFPLDNRDHKPLAHSVQFHILKAGQTENLPGDIAQIAVRQLVSYILMSQAKKGKPKLIADPFARMQTEKQVVKSITSAVEFFNQPAPVSVEEATKTQIEAMNKPEEPIADPPPGQGINYEPSPNPTS